MQEAILQNSVRASGHRLTRQRQLVLKVLAESQDHLDAETIHERVRDCNPNVSLATVYRTLNLLKELKLVDEIQLGEEHAHFEAASYQPHYHFTCQKCHRVIEFQLPQLIEIINNLLKERNISIKDISLQVSGLCPICRDSE